ncbi:mandelate racemase/muconate lactonizing enzyme family protein [Azospirillum sp. ST 5-10]|uniref:mandelate racemase/muconate lactonizing enzyme family protein n=1 Tax=unclassified Azospirillum TaxID=2630922 RepID=UPI003F4A1BA9
MGQETEIVSIEGFDVECRLPEPVGNALRVFDRRQALLVRLTTRSGVSGWGECWAFPAAAGTFIRTVLAPAVLGADAAAPRAVHARLREMLVPERRGLGHVALSGIDIALWDCCGRVAGQPIAALLGGRLRDRVMAYASGPLLWARGDRYRGLEQAVEGYAAAGFAGVKLRVGVGQRRDAEVIRAARSILGPDALLMVDFNEGASVRQAVTLAHAVEDARLAWIEEPVAHDNLPAYQRLSTLLPVALAGGESFCGVKSFRDALATGALDVVQPDLAICGGLSEAMRVAGLADAFETAVAPHVWGTGVNFLAALQFAAVLTARYGDIPFPLFEYDTGVNPLRSALYDEGPDKDGMMAVPDGPGLGVEIAIDRLSDFVTGHWKVE